MNLTTATPAEIDAEWAPLSDNTSAAYSDLVRANRLVRIGRGGNYVSPREAREAASAEERIPVLQKALQLAQEAEEPFKAEWARRGGWSRAYLVITNGQGHIHRSTNCRTTFLTTQFNWLIDLSGHDEQEIVDLAGERACTVCYASAPVELRLDRPTQLFSEDEKRRLADRAEREAKRAAKEAAKPKNADGSPLVLRDYGRNVEVKTDRAASNLVLHDLESLSFYGEGHPSAAEWRTNIETGIAYFARVQNRSDAEVRAEFNAKTAKKAQRDAWTVKATA